MGMGFLRLNRMLAKHKWRRKKNVNDEDEGRESEESSLALWLVVLAAVVLSIVVFGLVHTRQFF